MLGDKYEFDLKYSIGYDSNTLEEYKLNNRGLFIELTGYVNNNASSDLIIQNECAVGMILGTVSDIAWKSYELNWTGSNDSSPVETIMELINY